MAMVKRGFEVKIVLFLGLALLSCKAKGVDTVFDVTKFGAQADGETECAQAFIQAWNAACHSNGTSTLLIPPGNYMTGEVFFQGPCSASVTVQVEGTILAQSDLSSFTNGQWFSIQDIDGLILEGKGTFNGQGESAWSYDACAGKAKCDNRLPLSVGFNKVNNSLLQGINAVNSKGFHMKICESKNFTVQNIKITAPGNSPNTDGIHISRSELVTIRNSTIGTGDDCISIGEGSTKISISAIDCGPGHGISVGSLGLRPTEHDVRDVVVTNCTLTNTTNGARIKTWHQSPQIQASNISFQNIIMNDVKNPIVIDQHYGYRQKSGASMVKISNVHFKNIRGTTVSTIAVSLNCSDKVPCEGIELVDIDFTYTGIVRPAQNSTLTAACANAKATFTGKQSPLPCSSQKGPQPI